MSVVWVGLLGGAVGFFLGWLLARLRSRVERAEAAAGPMADLASATSKVSSLEQRIADVQATLGTRESELSTVRDEVASLRQVRGQLEASLDAEKAHSAQAEQAKTALRDAFKSLAAEALQTNNETFLSLALTSLGQYQSNAKTELESKHKAVDDVVKPIREALDKVETQLKAVEKERQGAYAVLTQQVTAMAGTQQQLRDETAKLVKALRSPTVRGRWGEIQLKRVVELAGMLEHCDFVEQETVTSDAGRLRPDIVVRLPGGKNIVVDAKAPLAAYLEAHESTDDATREASLREHARQVRDHMTQLAGKGYWAQLSPSPEMVVMFLPGETFFSAALQYDPSLIEYGVEQRVIPASPTTLISLLRAVHYGWRQEKLAENAQAISDLGRELYERLATWLEHVSRVGKGLTVAVTGYNNAVGSLESRVLVSARRFRELGGSAASELQALDPVVDAVREIQAGEQAAASDVLGAAPGKGSTDGMQADGDRGERKEQLPTDGLC